MSGLRLSVAGGMSRYSPLDPIPPSARSSTPPTTNSAALASAQRRIKELEEENNRLRTELCDVQGLYKQLIQESKHENYDERRINLLKSQMIQLEKQVLLLSDALSSRSGALLELENAVAAIAHLCRQCLSSKDRIGSVTVACSDLHSIIETAEAARCRLAKCIETTASSDAYARPLAFTSLCIKPNAGPVSLVDICSGSLEHLNLRHVAKLESSLAQVYRRLHAINQCLSTALHPPSRPGKSLKAGEIPKAVYVRLGGHISKVQGQLKDALRDLLDLTVLVPAAPWPVLKRPINKELSVEQIMKKLPAMSRAKAAEAEKTVEALVKAYNFQVHMARLQLSSQQEELKFHQSVYQLHVDHTMELMEALQEGYREFERDANHTICEPLKEVLRMYSCLKETGSEDGLKYFLQSFRQHEGDLQRVVQELSGPQAEDKDDKAALLSTFGEAFLRSLEAKRLECAKRRDDLAGDIDNLKEENKEHMSAMKDYFCTISAEEEREIMENLGGNDQWMKEDTPRNESRNELRNESRNESRPISAQKNNMDHGHVNEQARKNRRKKWNKQTQWKPEKEWEALDTEVPNTEDTEDTAEKEERPPWDFSTTVENQNDDYNRENSETDINQEEKDVNENTEKEVDNLPSKQRKPSRKKPKSQQENENENVDCTCGIGNDDSPVPSKQKPPVLKQKLGKPPTSENIRKGVLRTKLVLKPKSKENKSEEDTNAQSSQSKESNNDDGNEKTKEPVHYNIAAMGMNNHFSFVHDHSEPNTARSIGNPAHSVENPTHSVQNSGSFQTDQEASLSSRPPLAANSRPGSRESLRRNSDVIKHSRKDTLNRSGSEQSITGSNVGAEASNSGTKSSRITLARSGSLSSIHQMFDIPSTDRSQAGGRTFKEPLFPAGSFRSGGGGSTKSSPWR